MVHITIRHLHHWCPEHGSAMLDARHKGQDQVLSVVSFFTYFIYYIFHFDVKFYYHQDSILSIRPQCKRMKSY